MIMAQIVAVRFAAPLAHLLGRHVGTRCGRGDALISARRRDEHPFQDLEPILVVHVIPFIVSTSRRRRSHRRYALSMGHVVLAQTA
jgi:hypothetical protein